MSGKKRIGVLALQGAFIEHLSILEKIGVCARTVRLPADLDGLDGLIIPGGESTTIGKLAVDYHLIEPLRAFGQEHAIWGTCAGAIFLSKGMQPAQLTKPRAGYDSTVYARLAQPLLGLMSIIVTRNAFGTQVDSFTAELDIPVLAQVDGAARPFHAVFIRAPLIAAVDGAGAVLASLPDGRIVAAQEGHFVATSFHPELTQDDRFHRYFAERVVGGPLTGQGA